MLIAAHSVHACMEERKKERKKASGKNYDPFAWAEYFAMPHAGDMARGICSCRHNSGATQTG
jgi:hypothetical protein